MQSVAKLNDSVEETDAGKVQPVPVTVDAALLRRAEADFDRAWYEQTYRAQLSMGRAQGETAFAYYQRSGAIAGHDPNRHFSEILYRQTNRDVMTHLVRAKHMSGFLHWLQFGKSEPHRLPADRKLIERIRNVVIGIDQDYLGREYHINHEIYPHPVDFYFSRVKVDMLSPSSEFSEEGYIGLNPDVASGIKSGELISGYDHYLRTRGTEKRKIISQTDFGRHRERERLKEENDYRHKVLNENVPGIGNLAAFDMIKAMEYYSDPLQVEVTDAQAPGGLMVLVPHYLPEIVFGGYLAFFDFLEALKKRTGMKLHLCVMNHAQRDVHYSNLIRMRTEQPRLFYLFDQIHKFDNDDRQFRMPRNFSVISYSSELHYMAQSIANEIGRKPIFFIQEYEPDFHANTDMQTFSANSFLIPHIGIYNSAKLFEYFEKRTNVLQRQGGDYRYTVFENAIKPMPAHANKMPAAKSKHKVKRLIFYGRPEAHAGRNHFAMFVCGLKNAIRSGVFAGSAWEFISIGSLSFEGKIDLDGRHKLQVKAKVSKEDYEELLLSGDIGVSFITSPHPGIIHFQMASFGLPTLTNLTEFRTQDWLTKQNGNLIGVEMNLDSIAEGLKKAIAASHHVEQCWVNARLARTLTQHEAYADALQLMEQLAFE